VSSQAEECQSSVKYYLQFEIETLLKFYSTLNKYLSIIDYLWIEMSEYQYPVSSIDGRWQEQLHISPFTKYECK
jgi:hypothetical protein